MHMTRADRITISRLALTPLGVLLLFLPDVFGSARIWATAAVWIILIYSEISDYLDGYVARKYGEVSDFGKIFDPFCDVLMHLSYFVSFCVMGLLPLAFVLLVLFREYSILLLRLLMAKSGVMMGARPGGKAKNVSYVVTGAAVLARLSLRRLDLFPALDPILGYAVIFFCVVAGALSLLSFADYYLQFRKLTAKK
jgi:CDP-diacylglycerol---glycerol-3-phosphate 3-phosphatidyltransferase